MKRFFALLLVLVMVFSLVACGKKDTAAGGDKADGGNAGGNNAATNASGNNAGANNAGNAGNNAGNAGNNNYADEFATYTYAGADGGKFDVTDLDTGTGIAGVSKDIVDNNDLINPEKFGGKTIQIYGYNSATYEDLDNMGKGTFIWMVRAAVDEWAYLNNVTIDYVGGYDQSVILGDINAGGKPDLLLYCNKFPLPALTNITSPFTQEEYDALAKTTGTYYLDMLKYKGQSYGVQSPWSGGTLCYYNRTAFEEAGVKSPGEYFMEDNWTWDTFEECITDITQDTDGDGTIDLYGSGTTFWLIPHIYVRRLNDDGKLESLIRNSDSYMRFLEIYYRSCKETKSTGKYATAYIATTPRPATSFGDAEWYNYEHLNRELVNGDRIEVVPLPKYTSDSGQYYGHTTVYTAIMSSCDEREATCALINYMLRVGMRYISDFSLGLYKCNYEGIRGASPYSFGWKKQFEQVVADRQAAFDELGDFWDQELYQKMQDAVLGADHHYISYEFPGQDGNGVFNNESNQMPPASSMPIIATREEAWIQTYNDLYAG